jgi:hypothetical protein
LVHKPLTFSSKFLKLFLEGRWLEVADLLVKELLHIVAVLRVEQFRAMQFFKLIEPVIV